MDKLSKTDQEVLSQIVHGDPAQIEKAIVSATETGDKPGNLQDDLASRFTDGAGKLQEIGISEQPVGQDQLGRTRSALALLTRRNASTMTIVFNGNTRLLAVPVPLLSQYNTHVLVTRDPTRRFGFAGLPGLGATYDACVSNLRQLITNMKVEKLFCVGMSAGGATALKFGIDLKADGVLCFSSPTTLDINDDPGAEVSHYPQLARLYRTDRSLGVDLAKYYKSATPRPGLMMVYGADHSRDSWLAERVAGVKGAELIGLPEFSQHKTYVWANETGRIYSFLDRLFELKAVGV